jgi:hypothetical protein
MGTTPKQTFDMYRNRTNPSLRLATASGARVPRKFRPSEWTLMKEASVLHSDTPKDVATKGYCYFQVLKG